MANNPSSNGSGAAVYSGGLTGAELFDINVGPIKATCTSTQIAATPVSPVNAGATKTLSTNQQSAVIKLGTAAGSVVTLPAATGSGITYRFVVTTTTTSGAHKILANSSSDNLIGFVTGETAGTAKCFKGHTSDGFHSLQMPFAGTQPSGGFEGDWFDLIDVAANTWEVKGAYEAGTTPTTPFSTATS